jgi:hypothetical protein
MIRKKKKKKVRGREVVTPTTRYSWRAVIHKVYDGEINHTNKTKKVIMNGSSKKNTREGRKVFYYKKLNLRQRMAVEH